MGELLKARGQGQAPAPKEQAGQGPGVLWVETRLVRQGPFQARRRIDPAELEELAASIREHGVLQPLLVRAVEGGYELLAGERRWRAAQAAGLERVPVIVREADDRTAAELGLLENIQRSDLHFFEEAEGYLRLIQEFGVTQEELARRLGKSQGAVANKLRLLKLGPQLRQLVLEGGLGERHARALLRLEDPRLQEEAVRRMVRGRLSTAEAEELVERLLDGPPRGRRTIRGDYGDARIFVNGLRQVVAKARQAGFGAVLEEQEEPDGWVFTVKLARRRSPRARR